MPEKANTAEGGREGRELGWNLQQRAGLAPAGPGRGERAEGLSLSPYPEPGALLCPSPRTAGDSLQCRVRRAILTGGGEKHDGEAQEHGDVVPDPGMGIKEAPAQEGSSFPLGNVCGLGRGCSERPPGPPKNSAKPPPGHSSAPQPTPAQLRVCRRERKPGNNILSVHSGLGGGGCVCLFRACWCQTASART